MNIYLVIFITLLAALFGSFAQILYKRGLTDKIRDLKSAVYAVTNGLVLTGAAIYVAGLGVYLYALSNAPLSVVYPTFASTFIFVTIFSVLFLKERITGKRALGTLLVFFGIAIIAISI